MAAATSGVRGLRSSSLYDRELTAPEEHRTPLAREGDSPTGLDDAGLERKRMARARSAL